MTQETVDVYKKWGISEIEFLQLLNTLDIEINEPLTLEEGVFFDLRLKEIQNPSFGPIRENRDNLDIIRGWKVILDSEIADPKIEEVIRNDDDATQFIESFSNEYKRIDFNIESQAKINPADQIHKGHIIARRFLKYLYKLIQGLTPQEKGTFVGTSNKSNIIPQTSQANLNSSEIHGQAFFENIVDKFLKENTSTVYYEAEAIYYDAKDKIPIATRLYYKTIKVDEGIEPIEKHVLIPNVGKALQEGRDTYIKGFNDFVPTSK